MSQTFRHWTAAQRVQPIVDSGLIRATESNVHEMIPNYGPPVVWLLPSDVDPTDSPGDLPNGLYLAKTTGWVEVNVPAIRWLDWGITAHMDRGWKDAFIAAGGGMKSAEQWYVWPAAILRRSFVSASNGWTP